MKAKLVNQKFDLNGRCYTVLDFVENRFVCVRDQNLNTCMFMYESLLKRGVVFSE